ncbi:MAG: PQQ-dependent sugar dehydrogenase [Actinomycetota bacterium]
MTILSAGSAAAVPEWPESQLVAEGFEFPTGMAFLPDGTLLVNDRPGSVRVIGNGRLDPEPLAEIPTAITGETGLLGIAVPPDVDEDAAAYAFATAPDGNTNIIWRVPLDGSDIEPIVQGLPAAGYHNGGGVAFDEDGMLLISNGEQHDGDRAQDPEVLGGKVYRFNPDGSIPTDNPFSATSAALSIGLRNPYGLAIDPLSGAPWVTENGPESYDEINRIVPGTNYGWPQISGPEDVNELDAAELGLRPPYLDPVLAYEQVIVPTGITFATRDAPPLVEKGDLFFGSYAEAAIHHVRLDDDRTSAATDSVIPVEGPVVAIGWGPEGLYYSADDEVRMFPFAGGEEASPDASQSEKAPSPIESDEGPLGPLADEEGGLAWPALLILALFAAGIYFTRRRLDR